MPEQASYCQREGVYGWVRSLDVPEVSFFFPVNPEDMGKQEQTVLVPELTALVPGMLGIIAGGVDQSDVSYEYAVQREALEERGVLIAPNRIHNTLPTIMVSQDRHGELCSFSVHGHSVHVSESELARLQNVTPVVSIPDAGLPRFLSDQKMHLRPSVYEAGTRILQAHVLACI